MRFQIAEEDEDNMELTEVDKRLLVELREGARTQGFLVDETGESRHKVHQRLQLLAAAGIIENIHANTALYELRNVPDDVDLEDVDASSPDDESDREEEGG